MEKMELYYNDGLTSYAREIGGINFKLRTMRKAKKAITWYFSDRFGFSINVISLVVVML